MGASKHTIYLTRNHQLTGDALPSKNVFLFNENGSIVQSNWVRKNVELNDGSFVIMDHNRQILNTVEELLLDRSYYIERVDFSQKLDDFRINPFDLVHDTSEIHFMFLNFLHIMWDNADPDIAAMSNLIDAFASYAFFLFGNQREKLNMQTLRKLVYSVRATHQTDDGVVPLSDAIFAELDDQGSMPCKYYAQFKKAAGERSEEVAEKLAKVFDSFTENDMDMMGSTDWSLADSFRFKTAVFVNVDREEEEHSAKLMMTLFNYLFQQTEGHGHVLFILDELDYKYAFASLPYWMKDAPRHMMSFLAIGNDIASFAESARTERYFKRLQKEFYASVLVHRNDDIGDASDNCKDCEGCVATVIIPSEDVRSQDKLF